MCLISQLKSRRINSCLFLCLVCYLTFLNKNESSPREIEKVPSPGAISSKLYCWNVAGCMARLYDKTEHSWRLHSIFAWTENITYIRNISFFSLSQVQKQKNISLVWTILISLMKGWGLTMFQFQSSALRWCVKWSGVFLPCKPKQRWPVSYSSGLSRTSSSPSVFQTPSAEHSSPTAFSCSPTAFWRCWITGTVLLPLYTLAAILGPKLPAWSSMHLPYWNNDMCSHFKT